VAVVLDSEATLQPNTGYQDTWILIFGLYDRGGTDKGLFWQILASLQRSYKLLTSGNYWYWLGHLDWYE